MGKVTRNRRAQADLLRIAKYIARDNVDAALRFLSEIDETLSTLSDFPGMGPACDDLSPGMRSFPVGNYILFYRVRPDRIQLMRVIDGHRDLPPQFRKR